MEAGRFNPLDGLGRAKREHFLLGLKFRGRKETKTVADPGFKKNDNN